MAICKRRNGDGNENGALRRICDEPAYLDDEDVAVPPHRVFGVGEGYAVGISGVPSRLGTEDLGARGLLGERGQRRPVFRHLISLAE